MTRHFVTVYYIDTKTNRLHSVIHETSSKEESKKEKEGYERLLKGTSINNMKFIKAQVDEITI